MTIAWRHYSATGDSNGIAWVGTGNPTGSDVVMYGGMAEYGDSSSTSETHDGHALAAFVASRVDYDSGTDTTYVELGFRCRPGDTIRTHIWWVV